MDEDTKRICAELDHIRSYFEAKADTCIGNGKMLLLNWANMARDALELLKAQVPRLLTRDEVMALPNGEETNAPVVMEQRVPIGTWDGGSICQWRGAAFVHETAEDYAFYYNWDTYGQYWRCWSALPTVEQRKEVKWNDGQEKRLSTN